MPRTDHENAPAVITDAEPGASEEIDSRHKRYVVSMTIRMACFVGLVLVPSPWRWFFLVGAAVIPPIAVMFANISTRPPPQRAWSEDDTTERLALPTGEVIEGEIADDDRPAPAAGDTSDDGGGRP